MLKYFKYSLNTSIRSAYAVTRAEELKSVHLKCNLMHFLPHLLNICRKLKFLISQGSVAICLRWGGYCRMGFVANFIRFPAVQTFWKSVKIWQSYRPFKGENFLRHIQGVYPNDLRIHACDFRLSCAVGYIQLAYMKYDILQARK